MGKAVNNYEQEIRQMISDITGVPEEKIKMDADFFTDLGVDSLKAIEIVAAMERKYRAVVPEKDIPSIRTLRKIIDCINNLNR
jgi:acyl carrier protein